MKKVLVAVVACVVLSIAVGCTPVTTIGGGQASSHGLLSSFGAAKAVAGSDAELATYSTWLGLIDTGFPEYAAAVKQAHADGKVVITATTWYYFFTKTTAFVK